MKVFGRDILREVAQQRGLTTQEIIGRSKKPPFIAARLEVIARLRALDFPISKIARLVQRDHSTVFHHIKPGYRERAIERANRWYDEQRERAGKPPRQKWGNDMSVQRYISRNLLTEDDVRAIRESDEHNRDLALRYEVAQSTIEHVRARRTWKHVA
jgi:DNA-binding transcriptional MerR regulator